jgi:Ca2+-binding RTX toxin-like protein
VPGWPAKLAIVDSELLPDVGEGVTGYPVIGDASCGSGSGPKVGAMANNGAAYVFDPSGSSCYGTSSGHDIPLGTDFSVSATQVDRPVVPAVGSPAFANVDGTGTSFIAPAAGLMRALDVALPEYQPTGQDFVGVWSLAGGGNLRPGFPQPVNDLQFLTGPSVSDIDPSTPGQEILEGTASMDLNAFTAAGTEVSGWPKMTTDWTIANPTVGSFGTLDTDAAAHKVVIGLTRSGYINAYTTAAPACSPSAWPRFHHDNANSGDAQRDATLPGAPFSASVGNGSISFRAPGDDLMCGTANHYQAVTSDQPINALNFADATPLSGTPGPAAPGSKQTFTPGAGVKRYVAIRAVDEQGNIGRPLSVDFLGPPKPPPPACSNKITGTNRADVLRGTAQGDRINGEGGKDKIFGKDGADCLRGGLGDDRVFGGAGDDVIRVRGEGHDHVRCGAGNDTAYVGRHDHADHSCEDVNTGR